MIFVGNQIDENSFAIFDLSIISNLVEHYTYYTKCVQWWWNLPVHCWELKIWDGVHTFYFSSSAK